MWNVRIDYFAVGNPQWQDICLVEANFVPPSLPLKRFQFRRLMSRPDIQNTSSPEFLDFVADAVAGLADWQTGEGWESADTPALETALNNATP